MLTIYHNPRCSKSRQTLALIEEAEAPHTVVLYLETPPPVGVIKAALKAFGRDVALRKGEDAYKEQIKGKKLTDDELASIVMQHPIILERPLVVSEKGEMILGRPPENVMKLIG